MPAGVGFMGLLSWYWRVVRIVAVVVRIKLYNYMLIYKVSS